MRQPRNPDDWAPALPSPAGGREAAGRGPVRPRLAQRVSEGPREAPRALRMWWNRSGAGASAPRPEMRARRAGRGDHRGARGGASCGAGWGRLGALLRSPPTPPPPHPRVGRLVLDPPARAPFERPPACGPRNPPSASAVGWSGPRAGVAGGRATWLILPVVICLSQRLSHACVSMN
ncbi:unnamed protein product [Spirodela intermedia]|uniref:Uncharacterized protein n=1 Tax=Spirodela intermedia TaxID=51605 RepID=A0A7I8KP15_SPIIN|nr:unnamed protein product [Spirodela intermedia]CAA7398814.1 unnamed protein product [Spirodela intermedia]